MNAYQHFVIEALRAINASEIQAYQADEGQFAAWVSPTEDTDALERKLDDLHVFTGRLYGYVRQIIYNFEPNSENQHVLETISTMGALGLNEIVQVLLPRQVGVYLRTQGRDVPIFSAGEIETILIAALDAQWVTVDEAADQKGINAEVLRRLLRDDTRQRFYFPTAQEPRAYWLLRKREVGRWQPAEVGRPRRPPLDELND